MDDALRVREFWFGNTLTGAAIERAQLATRAQALAQRSELWFGGNSQQQQQRDELIRTEFGDLLERSARGELDGWADSPRRRLSLILLLDQFSRQIHRGTPQAFEYDEKALALTLTGMQSAADAALNVVERIFFYMPLQHAESLEAQDESVNTFRRLAEEAPSELRATFEESVEAAQAHRELIAQFGRFPHRNELLGRPNTPEEQIYLEQHPEGFGQ